MKRIAAIALCLGVLMPLAAVHDAVAWGVLPWCLWRRGLSRAGGRRRGAGPGRQLGRSRTGGWHGLGT